MVKIPGLDELKRFGSDLVDTAKAAKMGSLGTKKTADLDVDTLHAKFIEINKNLDDLHSANAIQGNLIHVLRKQVAEVLKEIDKQKKPSAAKNPSDTNDTGASS